MRGCTEKNHVTMRSHSAPYTALSVSATCPSARCLRSTTRSGHRGHPSWRDLPAHPSLTRSSNTERKTTKGQKQMGISAVLSAVRMQARRQPTFVALLHRSAAVFLERGTARHLRVALCFAQLLFTFSSCCRVLRLPQSAADRPHVCRRAAASRRQISSELQCACRRMLWSTQ